MFTRIAIILSMCLVMTAEARVLPEKKEVLAEDILIYINQFRVRNGLPKLHMNSLLTQEAAKHSADMAQHRVAFGHDGFEDRIAYLKNQIQTAQGGAENVAYNYKTAKVVAEGWINSPGHRRNILGRYNETGIGIVRDKTGKLYFTQLFLKA